MSETNKDHKSQDENKVSKQNAEKPPKNLPIPTARVEEHNSSPGGKQQWG
jgi:hypothetical protein